MGTSERHADRVLRAITDDDNFRVITACTTETVRNAFVAQSARGATAQLFGDLLTGTILIRETMSPHYRVQGILKGLGGRGSLVADAHPDGTTRGLVQLGRGMDEFALGEGSVLQMMRSMAHGGVYRGVVQPPDTGGVPAALMTYMQTSEQVLSVIATGIRWTGDEVCHAGGYLIQLLPGYSRGALMIMTERLEAMPPIDELLAQHGGSPRRLLDELLYGMPFAQLDDRPLAFGCKCSREAVVSSLATLGRADLAELCAEDVIELRCDYCNAEYKIGRQQLEGLLQTS